MTRIEAARVMSRMLADVLAVEPVTVHPLLAKALDFYAAQERNRFEDGDAVTDDGRCQECGR